jgi:hypothetical protein
MSIITSFGRTLGLTFAGLLLAISNAHAGAGATFEDICSDGQGGPHPFECNYRQTVVNQRVIVTVSADAQDSGRIGGFYVGVRSDGLVRGMFTTSGWKGWNGGLFEPVSMYESLPGSSQQYVVLDGGLLCPQLGGGSHELWAGYGILNDNGLKMVANYKDHLSKGLTYEHLVRTYVQHEMSQSERAWKVLEITCPGAAGIGG